MSNTSLLFASSLQAAEDAALIKWKWEVSDLLHFEFRRPDNGERVRFVQDAPFSCSGHRWNTTVYLGYDWQKRKDAAEIRALVLAKFFVIGDPELPPPRRRNKEEEPDGRIQARARRT